MYTGILYNDLFSKSMNIFGSSWSVHMDEEWVLDENHKDFDLDPAKKDYAGSPYPLGIDPVWQVSYKIQ